MGLEELSRHDEGAELGRCELDLGFERVEPREIDRLTREFELDARAGEEAANVVFLAPGKGFNVALTRVQRVPAFQRSAGTNLLQ